MIDTVNKIKLANAYLIGLCKHLAALHAGFASNHNDGYGISVNRVRCAQSLQIAQVQYA